MSRPKTYGAIAVALLLGVAIGAFGGHRYAQQKLGRELLSMLHRDSENTLKTYERIRDLAHSNDDEKLLKYLDAVIRTESAALTATQTSESTGEEFK